MGVMLRDGSGAEHFLEVLGQGIDVDGFGGQGVSVGGVPFASALGLTQILPVGRLIACSAKTRALDEGF